MTLGYVGQYAEGLCAHCREVALLPLGRPRADGSRHPMRYCSWCISQRRAGGIAALNGGGREAHLRAKRLSGRRRRAEQEAD